MPGADRPRKSYAGIGFYIGGKLGEQSFGGGEMLVYNPRKETWLSTDIAASSLNYLPSCIAIDQNIFIIGGYIARIGHGFLSYTQVNMILINHTQVNNFCLLGIRHNKA